MFFNAFQKIETDSLQTVQYVKETNVARLKQLLFNFFIDSNAKS